MRGGIGERSALLAILALCAAAAFLVVLIALDTTPIADDYGDLPHILHSSVFQYLHNYWVGLTDRYSDAIFMVVLVKLFGAAAIHVATPLLLALLLCLCVAAARALSATAQPSWATVAAGCLAAIVIVASTPSIFDTLGWFNATAIYLAGVVAAVGTATWMVTLALKRAPVTRLQTAASFGIGLLAAGFTELIGTVIVLGSLLAVANVRDVLVRGPRRRSLEIAYAAVGAGAAIGLLTIALGPGSHARIHTQHAGFDLARIIRAAWENLGWASANVGWRTLTSIAGGLALLRLRGTSSNEGPPRWPIAWVLFLCCVPMVVVGAAAGLSGVIYAPLRAVSVGTASIAIGEAGITYLVAAALVRDRPRLAMLSIPGAAIATAAGVIGFADAATPVIRAELLRRAAIDARAVSIRRQLREHPRSVSMMPAPLIVFDSNAYDFLFGRRRQLSYVFAGTRQYYGIPPGVAIHVIARQPRHYCLADVSIPAYGVKPCPQLASATRASRQQ